MKANELRVGNWYKEDGEICQVTSNLIEDFWSYEIAWCEAIPLTDEWLLKFGFEEKDGGYILWDKNIYIKDNVYYYGTFGYPPNKLELKYVHQLQNLVHALTGEELTIKQ